MQGQALPGFRDFYPDELALRNYIFATWREVARRYAFQEYDGPPLEPLELFTEKSGAEIEQQLYAFEDKGGRKVALRPEMTPTLARMVAPHAQALKKPTRWFSIPQLSRHARHQRGRLRESPSGRRLKRCARWGWANSSPWISRSSVGSRITPESCSSCSTRVRSCGPSAAAAATTAS